MKSKLSSVHQQFQPVRMPDKFENYDVDGDGRITLSELRYVTGATEGAAEAFSAADVDGKYTYYKHSSSSSAFSSSSDFFKCATTMLRLCTMTVVK